MLDVQVREVDQKYRDLPIVDIGAHDGTDYTIPGATRGHRVYCYEPTPKKFNNIVQSLHRLEPKVMHTTNHEGFRNAAPGTVLLRPQLAVSDKPGHAKFSVTEVMGGVGNSLQSDALPGWMKERSTMVHINLTTLSADLALEDKGVYLLKIDSQGWVNCSPRVILTRSLTISLSLQARIPNSQGCT